MADIQDNAALLVDEIECSLPQIISRLKIPEPAQKNMRERLGFQLMGRRGFRLLSGSQRLNAIAQLKLHDFFTTLRGVQQIVRDRKDASASEALVFHEAVRELTDKTSVRSRLAERLLTNREPFASLAAIDRGTTNPIDEGSQETSNRQESHGLHVERLAAPAKTVLEGDRGKNESLDIPNIPIEVQEPLAGRDIRDLIALMRGGRLVAFLDPIADELVGKDIEKVRVPKKKLYASIDSERLLPEYHRLSLSLEHGSSEAVSEEVRLLDALLSSLENEAQWSRINKRRFHLITKRHTRGLSANEETELATLQDLTDKQMYGALGLPFRSLAMLESYVRSLEIQDSPNSVTEPTDDF